MVIFTSRTIIWSVFTLFFGVFLFDACGPTGTPNSDGTITPVEFSDPKIPGFAFPEDSTKIYKWLNERDTNSIFQHAWGIWAGLIAPTNQVDNGDTLLTFETWMGPQELAKFCAKGNTNGGCDSVKSARTPLSIPRQFSHAQLFANGGKGAAGLDTINNFNEFETVSYNPEAACHATTHLIFNQSAINKYTPQPGKIGRIPGFPNNAITTKPTYYAGKADADGLIRIPVWNNNDAPADQSDAFDPSKWKTFVYADMNNGQKHGKALTPAPVKATTAQVQAATCNINDFIHFSIDAAMADYLNKKIIQDPQNPIYFNAGDEVLLVAMHVGTKEISNWTWQTFYWDPNPDNPQHPGNAGAAKLRPAQLKGAAAHYSVSTAYTMGWPNQPVTRGDNTKMAPLVAFNPYLEAGFPPFTGSFATAKNITTGGRQSNCMSCHALATPGFALGYVGATYVDMNDTSFQNKITLDFGWSIAGNINQDVKDK